VPTQEEVIWEGHPSIWYYLLRIFLTSLWIIVCLILGFAVPGILSMIVSRVPQLRGHLARYGIRAWYAQAVFFFFALLLCGRIVRLVLTYLMTYYVFTTQRLKLKAGIILRSHFQIELFKLKDFAVVQSLFGRICNYAHIRLISSERIMDDVIVRAVPGGVETAERIRVAAQWSRAQSGLTTIRE